MAWNLPVASQKGLIKKSSENAMAIGIGGWGESKPLA